MRTVLVVGFGPFPGAPRNPSADLVRSLARRRRPALADVRIISAVLPTTYAAVVEELPALLKRHDPDLVLFFGLAGGANAVRIESRAVNAASAIHPDARRAKLTTREVVRGSPAELKVTAPLRQAAAAVRLAGMTAVLSRDAGRYICNAALFAGLDLSRRTGRPARIAFIHIPWPRGRSHRKAPLAQTLVRAGEAALVALLAANKRG
jgi:pyroglutamyl-peptidase